MTTTTTPRKIAKTIKNAIVSTAPAWSYKRRWNKSYSLPQNILSLCWNLESKISLEFFSKRKEQQVGADAPGSGNSAHGRYEVEHEYIDRFHFVILSDERQGLGAETVHVYCYGPDEKVEYRCYYDNEADRIIRFSGDGVVSFDSGHAYLPLTMQMSTSDIFSVGRENQSDPYPPKKLNDKVLYEYSPSTTPFQGISKKVNLRKAYNQGHSLYRVRTGNMKVM